MISKEFFAALDEVAISRDIKKEKILMVMEHGLLNAYKKAYNKKQKARVVFKELRNEIQIFAIYEVVNKIPDSTEFPELQENIDSYITVEQAQEFKKNPKIGDIIEKKVTPKDFGRIAAGSVKQILTQGLKQLERENRYEHFKELEGEMINASVTNVSDSFVTLDLGKNSVASIPKKELLQKDDVVIGDRIKVYISKVEEGTKGPKIFVSRADKNLVKRLFEQLIPEIEDGVIEIMGLARDAGDRSKVCVASNDPNVDPVGACLGTGGSRVKEVIAALNGEKMDIYKYDSDTATLVANSLQPATVIKVIVDEKGKSAVAIVDDSQLSLAIGKKGQNARLAVQSCGWKIDIKSVEDAQKLKLI